MIPAEYANFLVASTQASAVLVGLIFVSVSIAPERTFGRRAESGRQAQAVSAFTALANVFFISFSGLIPGQPIGPVVLILGILAVSQTLSLLLLVSSWRREGSLVRGLTLFVLSGVVYAYEIASGVRLWQHAADTGALTTLLELMLGAYAIGLARAWELLGASYRSGLVSNALAMLQARLRPPASGAGEPPAPEDR